MITESEMYWMNVVGNLHIVCCAAIVIIGFAIVVGSIVVLESSESEDKAKNLKKFLLIVLPILLLDILGVVFIPSTQEMWMIKGVPAIVRSETVRKNIPAVIQLVSKEFLIKEEEN